MGTLSGHGRLGIHPRHHRRKRCTLNAARFLLLLVIGCVPLLLLLERWWIQQNQNGFNQNGHNDDFGGDFVMNQRLKQQQKSLQRGRNTRKKERPVADGFFNGAPLTLRQRVVNPQSVVHCVGDNYLHLDQAWKGRSCHFSSLFCFNTTSLRFVVFESHTEHLLRKFQDRLAQPSWMHVSSTMETTLNSSTITKSVSLGGINLKWGVKGIRRLQWFPDIQRNVTELAYYALPDTVILIPFHSLNAANPGHLVWDDFLAIYNLLDMFDLVNNNNQDVDLMLMRYILRDGKAGLWAACDYTEEKTALCNKMLNKYLPLLIGTNDPYNWSTTEDFNFVPHGSTSSTNTALVTDLVCASHGVAGYGALTDHGISKKHGWDRKDYEFVHNHGRGGLIRSFRNFAVQNLNLATPLRESSSSSSNSLVLSPRVVFSTHSSDIHVRNIGFNHQIDLVQQAFPLASVEAYQFKTLTLQEEMNIAHHTDVFVTICGGGAVTAMFLPPGASVILFYLEKHDLHAGRDGKTIVHKPSVLLDWDLFSAMTHVRVHWMPRLSMNSSEDRNAFVALIRREVEITFSSKFQ